MPSADQPVPSLVVTIDEDIPQELAGFVGAVYALRGNCWCGRLKQRDIWPDRKDVSCSLVAPCQYFVRYSRALLQNAQGDHHPGRLLMRVCVWPDSPNPAMQNDTRTGQDRMCEAQKVKM